MAILRAVQISCPELTPTFCAGLSLGEYTALVAANILSFEDALLLVKARGSYMQVSCDSHPGTMQVVLGLDYEAVKSAADAIEGAWVANLNCPGQIVISGTRQGIEALSKELVEKGARRVMPLDVSGAFHSGLMQEARDHLKPLIEKTELHASEIQIVMNVPGSLVKDPSEIRENMTAQVTEPVFWQKGIEAMLAEGVELFIEMGPGKTLAGMNKRIKVPFPTHTVEQAQDLERLKGEINAIA